MPIPINADFWQYERFKLKWSGADFANPKATIRGDLSGNLSSFRVDQIFMSYLLDSMMGQTILLAQDYNLVIAVVILCIFLGTVMIIIPRPRKKYLTATEERDANMRKVNRKRPAVPQSAAVPQQRPPGQAR